MVGVCDILLTYDELSIGVEIVAKLIPQTILLCNVIDYTN